MYDPMIPVICYYLPVISQIQPTCNLAPGLYKAGRDPLQTYAISYDSQYKSIDHRSRGLRHTDGLNLSNSCVSVAFLFLITRLSADQSTFVGYPRMTIDRERVYDESDSIARIIQKCNLKHELDERSLCSH